MKIKIALHWQILIALVIAVIYGIIFPTKYIFTDKSYKKLSENQIDISSLKQFKDIKFTTYLGLKNAVIRNVPEQEKNINIIKKTTYNNPAINAIDWTGTVFLRLLKMLIIPLIFSSLISAIVNVGSKGLGKLGIKTIGYYIATSSIAIITGLIIVNLIKPGIGIDTSLVENVEGLTKGGSLKDTLTNMVPSNIIESMSKGEMLPIIFFAVIFGVFITKTKEKTKKIMSNLFKGTSIN